MTDIAVGLIAITVVSVTLFKAARWLADRIAWWQCDVLAAVIVMLTFAYLNSLWYSVRLVEWLPFSNLIVVGNWFPPLSALLVGMVWDRLPGGFYRRSFTSGALFITAAATVCAPLLGSTPDCRNSWSRDGICQQTTDESCTAACAATALTRVGISATEQEMAELCFSGGGTTWLGLYRGLKLKTANTPWEVKVLDVPSSELASHAGQPLILSVGVELGTRVDGAFELESGWRPGFRHSVLLFGSSRAGVVEIGDPNPQIGRERWTTDELDLLFRGPALQLVHR